MSETGKGREEILRETGATVGLADVSFDVDAGELFVLMGLSGSGKSTLLRAINRLSDPTSGEVHIGDTNVTSLDVKALRHFRRKNVGMVFQHFALLPHRSVLDNVAYGLEVQGLSREVREKKALDAIQTVGLGEWANEPPDSLSGGMKQRVGVARALCIEPEVLLMDEPFSALDPLIRSSMQQDLEDLREELGKTIVFVTHDLDEALTLGDRIAIMREGRIVQTGAPADIAVHPEDEYIENFVADVNRARVLTAADVMREPVVRLGLKDSPKAAVRRMDEHDVESAFVRDEDGRLAGMLLMPDALAAVKKGDEAIREHVREAPTVQRDTPVENIVHLVLERGFAAAVVDDKGKLVGVVRHKSLLPAFSREEREVTADV